MKKNMMLFLTLFSLSFANSFAAGGNEENVAGVNPSIEAMVEAIVGDIESGYIADIERDYVPRAEVESGMARWKEHVVGREFLSAFTTGMVVGAMAVLMYLSATN